MGEEKISDHEHCSDYFAEPPTPEDVQAFYTLAANGVVTVDVLQAVIDLRLKALGIDIVRVDA
jgi:hypothetical protein